LKASSWSGNNSCDICEYSFIGSNNSRFNQAVIAQELDIDDLIEGAINSDKVQFR